MNAILKIDFLRTYFDFDFLNLELVSELIQFSFMIAYWCTGSWGTQILNGTKKKFKKVLVGGSASWGKCQLGEVPVGRLVPVGGQKFNPWTEGFFSNFVGGENLTPFLALNDLK